MKLASIRLDGNPVWGRVEGDEIIVPDKAFLHANPHPEEMPLPAMHWGMILEVRESARVPVADAVFDPLITDPWSGDMRGDQFQGAYERNGPRATGLSLVICALA